MKTREILATLIAVGVIAIGAGFAAAETISVNLRIGANDNNSVDTDETAGVVPISGQHWNNITIAATKDAATYYNTSSVLKDDQGNVTAATLTSTLQSGDAWSSWSDVTNGAARGFTGDAGMMQSDLLYDVQADGGRHLEVSGLGSPFTSGYDVYLYFEAATARKVEFKLTPTVGSPVSVFGADSGDNSDTNDDGVMEWKQATGTDLATANSANYAKFTGLTAPGFAIDLDGDTGRGMLNGFQIVEAPVGPPPPAPAVDEIIGINFMRNSSLGWTQLGATDSVGVIPSVNWNNVNVDLSPDHAFGPLALSDASGTPTGVMIMSDIDEGYDNNNGNGNATPDHVMMNGSIYYDNGIGTDTGGITISDLPARFTDPGYDVYLYFESNANDRDMTFTIDGGQIAGRDAGAFSLYTLAAGPGIPANYMVWHNLTDSSFTIDATSTNGRAAIAGIQIVPHVSTVIPEPATMCAIALAVTGLGGYLRKRRKTA